MSVMREEFHRLAGRLPGETVVAPPLQRVRDQLDEAQTVRDLLRIGRLETELDFAECAEGIL